MSQQPAVGVPREPLVQFQHAIPPASSTDTVSQEGERQPTPHTLYIMNNDEKEELDTFSCPSSRTLPDLERLA